MIEEQEEVRGRLFTIQDVMQSTLRAWLQVSMPHKLILFVSLQCSIANYLILT
jgi:hypothetical protein